MQRYNNEGLDVLGPYIDLALTYGWANKMFATNQGPSFPAHQFIYGATSAPLVNNTENDDASGRYAAENATGCLDTRNVTVIDQGNEDSVTFPCFTHKTLGTLFIWPTTTTWRYYTPGEKGLWTAPEAILSECGISNAGGGNATSCPGPEFQGGANANVVTDPKQVLTDIGNCQLQSLNWVIPKGQYSDHGGEDTDEGPQWVASIVNSIGTSQCTDNGSTYWQDTAIIVTWDDWGGWYDHEVPLQNTTQYYQLGFRVPLLFVSAYGPNNANGQCVGYIEGSGVNQNEILDFGSIADFIEGNFMGGWSPANEGKLGFADSRALQRSGRQDLSDFVKPNQPACTFVPIPTWVSTQDFIDDTSPMLPPDDE